MGENSQRGFFISYTAVNEPWAKWIAVTLDRAGYVQERQGDSAAAVTSRRRA